MKTRTAYTQLLILIPVVALLATGAGCQSNKPAATAPPTKASQAATTPAQALARLKAGNERFVAGRPVHRNLPAEREATAAGQYPFAVVLSCLDSRCSTELVFDQGLGDVFNARVAGNVLNDDILGSMEFACQLAGARLIAVIGHTSCGAVKGACNDAQLGHLTALVGKIKPAMSSVTTAGGPGDPAYVDAVARQNVLLVMAQIQQRSPILAALVRDGQVGLVGGMQDLKTGRVVFLN